MLYIDDVVQKGHHIVVTRSRFTCYRTTCTYIRLELTFGLCIVECRHSRSIWIAGFLGPTTVEAVLSVIYSELQTRGMRW